jgi:hypothetical protein
MRTGACANRLARWWLVAAVTAMLLAAWAVPWHSNLTVDDRTYLEMIQAVSAHGLPYRDGSAVDRFPELRARWHVVRNGRLWSIYPPLFAYVATPAYRLGGVRGVIRFNVALLAAIAIGAFGLARRLGGGTPVAVLAGAAVIVCAPVWAQAIVVNSAPLAVALVVWSVCLALDAVESETSGRGDPRRRAALAGLVAGAAIATNLLSVGMVAGLGVAMSAPRIGSRRSGAWFWAGVAPAVAAMAVLNRVRFGSFNPISYGPCVWRSCEITGISELTLRAQLGSAWAFAVWISCVGLATWLARGSRRGLAAVAAAACATLVAVPVLRHELAGMLTIGYALIVDVSGFDLGNGFSRASAGPGVFLDRWVIKSLIQSTPFAPVAVVALLQGTAHQRRQAALVLAPCAALIASIMLRGNLPLAYALGFPFVHERFMMFAAPLVVALAIVVFGRLCWDPSALAILAAVACVGAIWLGRVSGDDDTARRFLLLRGSLALAGVTLFAVARSNRWTPWIAATAVGYAVAVTLAVDLPAFIAVRNQDDAQLELVARRTPASFALVGWPREIDPVLALTETRAIEYADLYEADGTDGIRRLITWWTGKGLPIVGLFPSPTPSPWRDVWFQPLDGDGRLVRMVPVKDDESARGLLQCCRP